MREKCFWTLTRMEKCRKKTQRKKNIYAKQKDSETYVSSLKHTVFCLINSITQIQMKYTLRNRKLKSNNFSRKLMKIEFHLIVDCAEEESQIHRYLSAFATRLDRKLTFLLCVM